MSVAYINNYSMYPQLRKKEFFSQNNVYFYTLTTLDSWLKKDTKLLGLGNYSGYQTSVYGTLLDILIKDWFFLISIKILSLTEFSYKYSRIFFS